MMYQKHSINKFLSVVLLASSITGFISASKEDGGGKSARASKQLHVGSYLFEQLLNNQFQKPVADTMKKELGDQIDSAVIKHMLRPKDIAAIAAHVTTEFVTNGKPLDPKEAARTFAREKAVQGGETLLNKCGWECGEATTTLLRLAATMFVVPFCECQINKKL